MHKESAKPEGQISLQYAMDEHGKEVLLKEGKFQVMMEWEKPYMNACIDALQPFGDILEIGFGCGYSAERIQAYHPQSHTIVECDPEVAKRAREFAVKHPNVSIVEDTWQNALDKLGVFDIVFFDDYPLESEGQMRSLKKEADSSHLVLEKGRQMLSVANELLSGHLQQKYQDEDIEEFFQLAEREESFEPLHLLRFFKEVQASGQITEEQLKAALHQMVDKGWIDESEIKGANNPILSSPFAFDEKGDRLFDFLSRCLDKHMRKGSRFSCFLEDPTSKFQDKKFFEHIIANPQLDYTEMTMEIAVPDNCRYYKGNTALVITITKMCD